MEVLKGLDKIQLHFVWGFASISPPKVSWTLSLMCISSSIGSEENDESLKSYMVLDEDGFCGT